MDARSLKPGTAWRTGSLFEPQDREAANLQYARDPARLLQGEQPDTAFLADAIHWLGVYRELLDFNRQLIEGITQRILSIRAGEDAAEVSDLQLVQAHVQRLEGRLRFWKRRRDELDASVSH